MDYQWEKVETTLTQVLDSDKRLAQYNNRIYLLGGYKSPSLDSKTVFMFDSCNRNLGEQGSCSKRRSGYRHLPAIYIAGFFALEGSLTAPLYHKAI